MAGSGKHGDAERRGAKRGPTKKRNSRAWVLGEKGVPHMVSTWGF